MRRGHVSSFDCRSRPSGSYTFDSAPYVSLSHMTPRLLTTLFIAVGLVATAVFAASALAEVDPTSQSSGSTEVLGARITASPSTASTTRPATTKSTTTTRPLESSPGPLAAPTPTAPVALPRSTPALDRIPTTDKVIFLGIDDGLIREPALIALLQETRVPLTLFLNQAQARDGADFFRTMQTLGATIQGHTNDHPRLPALGYSAQQHEICSDVTALTTVFGYGPTLFRPPYGEWNETTRQVAAGCGMKALILWRGATNDGRLDLVGGPAFHPGDILLLHFRADLIQNLKLVFAKAEAEGYRIGRLEDYLGTGPPHPMFTPAD